MQWFFIALGAPVLWAIVNISDQYLVAKYSTGTRGSGGLVLFSSLIGIFVAVFVGIFTDGDLRRLVEKTEEIFKLKAREIMVRNPKTIEEEALAVKALNRMEFFNITCLIVPNGNKEPVGILHLHDLLKAGVV